MDTGNRFVKLLTISIDKRELLLYGFSISTKQEIRPWEKKKNKLKLNVRFAILTYEKAKHFEQLLTGEDDIHIGNMTLIAPSLTVRDPVLNYRNGWEKSDPIPYLCYLNEFWNTQKENIVRQVEAALGTLGKQLYTDMQGLLAQIKAECGIDFTKNSFRFGNYERYDILASECRLTVVGIKESAGKRIVIRKSTEWNRPLIVNCVVEAHGRILLNRIRELLPMESELEFTTGESIERYTIYVWDRETGEKRC